MTQRSPELEVLASSGDAAVADPSVRRKQLAGGAVLVLLGLAAGYFVLAGRQPPPHDMLEGDEEFSTTSFRPPSFMREREPAPKPPAPEVIELPPPPPPPPAPAVQNESDTTAFNVPPPPASTAEHAGPVEPVEEFPARLRSKMIVYDNQATAGDENGEASRDADGRTVAGEDRNSKFLAAAAGIGDRSASARKIQRIDALVPEGTLIPGILETAIVSDLPGQIRAIVSQDVYSFDGRRILIATGSRLIGEYQSEITRGQKRIFVIWTRLLRNDGVSVRLNSIGADSLGRSGLTGRVDNKFRERFGAAMLLSVVGGASNYLTGYGSQAASGKGDEAQRAEDLARTTIAQTFSDMANQALADSLKIPPTISVPQGERIFVFVRQDLDFSALYDDPVTEAYKEIRHARGLN
ncbi:type IV secretion system protein VirB10 [Mesorhizobium sp. B1-1-8]|uniref:type IV secretion system protein VirB10 n=1 Tax=Mesorhizobium sp. B1-1-8 TaxID=2589976 RepID=UPI00112CB0C3|nr:type IV secretion system protein VirB10 [Mesorhizobium sp. B1-1-8]UCI10718.1 type IV secretion system protein VirB10 [Mesorhizobium sp. B1-1-8]